LGDTYPIGGIGRRKAPTRLHCLIAQTPAYQTFKPYVSLSEKYLQSHVHKLHYPLQPTYSMLCKVLQFLLRSFFYHGIYGDRTVMTGHHLQHEEVFRLLPSVNFDCPSMFNYKTEVQFLYRPLE